MTSLVDQDRKTILSRSQRQRPSIRLVLPTSLFSLLVATPAWAVQSHGGAEGLISHQIGHILFTVGMICLLIRINNMGQKGSGWSAFKVFLWLLLVWNLVTFTGHWMNEHVAAENFIKEGAITLAFTLHDLFDIIYYLTRLDHLVLVPAFLFLFLALKRWRQES